jgi:capsular polysaccharide biosynthesis protein
MELRQYWQIVRRRSWIVVALVLIVCVASLALRPPRTATFQTSMRFMLGLEPETKTGDYYTYDKYYTWLTAEYLVDDVAELVRSAAFAQSVSDKLAGQSIFIPVGTIQGSTQSGRLHRILTVSITWGDATQLAHIANAVAELLPTEIARHLASVGQGNVTASLIDPPAIGAVGSSLREKLDLPIRLILALLAGLVLAFVLDYLDQGVRSRQEIESAGVQVVAEIPPLPSSMSKFGRRAP